MYENPVPAKVLHDPALDEGRLRILQPNVTLARKVILPLNAFDGICAPTHLFRLDEGGGKGVGSRGALSRMPGHPVATLAGRDKGIPKYCL